MQISTGTESSKSLVKVAKNLVNNVINDINGSIDFLVIGLTSNYQNKKEYQEAIRIISENSGTNNIMGGTFPAVGTNGEIPTIQGGAALAIKSNHINFEKPEIYPNIRVKKKNAVKEFSKLYKKRTEKSKIGFMLTTGPTLLPNAMEQLKILDSYPARKFKKVFNFLADGLEWFLGKKGLGTGAYIDEIITKLSKNYVDEIIGGGTFNIDLEKNFQFQGNNVEENSLIGTVLSSDKLKFGHSWGFDRSEKGREYLVTDFLNSGYIQQIEKTEANQKLLLKMDIPRDLYNKAFETFSYANALYLSGLKEEEGYYPFMTANHPKLKGVVSTLPKSKLQGKHIKAKLFTQSGDGIQRSASLCANKASNNLKVPKFGIFINCANRLLIAGDKIAQENDEIEKTLGDDVPFISLYSGFEFSIIKRRPIYSAVSLHGLVAGE